MQLPWIKRSDLSATRHDSGGWVIKDPIALKYAMLDDAEYAMLTALDGKTTFAVLLEKLQSRFPGRNFTQNDLSEFLQALAGHQLIRQIVPGEHQRLYSKKQRTFSGLLLGLLVNVLRLQIPLFNPNRSLQRVLPRVRLLFSQTTVLISAVVCAAAMSIVVLRFGEIRRSLPNMGQFLGPENILMLLCIFVVVKVIHEAGHAFTARYFGAECNECGVMLLVLTPVLYTNVTDSWTLPKRQRMLVTAAGIWVELVIASVCVLLWFAASDGVAKSILLNTMLLCSLNTVLFNGNPLLRFDGYFLLTDGVGIPNLAGRSSAYLQSFMIQAITGVPQVTRELPPVRRLLAGYGILAAAYRLLLTIGILKLLQEVSREWRMEIAGDVISIVLLTGSLFFPLLGFVSEVAAPDNIRRYQTKNYARILGVLVVVMIVLLIPLPDSIVAPATVQSDSGAVYAKLPGAITPLVRYGDRLQKDQPIAQLSNNELKRTLESFAARAAAAEIQVEVLVRDIRTANSESIRTLEETAVAANNQLRSFEEEIALLTILADRSGTFVPPPTRPKQTRSDLPQLWHDTPVTDANTGAWIERGTLLGYVIDEWEIKVFACVGEKDIENVAVGQAAAFFGTTSEISEIPGEVVNVSRIPATTLSESLSAAGLVTGEQTSEGLKPQQTSYIVTLQFTPDQKFAAPAMYSVGQVRIQVGRISMLKRMVRFLRQTF